MKLYRVRNTTKNEWFYVWSTTTPTEDPDNPGDNIDPESAVIVEKNNYSRGLTYSLGVDTKNSRTTYKAEGRISFPGIDRAANIHSISFIGRINNNNSGRAGSVRIYDVTNNTVISEKEFNNTEYSIIEFDTISNVPETAAIWEVQVKRIGKNNTILCDSVSILIA